MKDALHGLVNAHKKGLLGDGVLAVETKTLHSGHLYGGLQSPSVVNMMGKAQEDDDDH